MSAITCVKPAEEGPSNVRRPASPKPESCDNRAPESTDGTNGEVTGGAVVEGALCEAIAESLSVLRAHARRREQRSGNGRCRSSRGAAAERSGLHGVVPDFRSEPVRAQRGTRELARVHTLC